ncbi:MAG: helix-turn-helix domain-containing protein [Alistipes sp.]|nr:helix-turn-helix domain-containing protein [Alistipes sp.]
MKNSEAEHLELIRSLSDEGKTYREIAEIVDCSVSTVHKYLAKLN